MFLNYNKYGDLMKKFFNLFLLSILFFSISSCKQNIENDLTIVMNDNNLKIAQFADLHFGIEGEMYHNKDNEKTIRFMDHIVETSNPDLIVLSGDNIMNSGIDGMKEIVEIMEKYKTPWTLVYGNHDAEYHYFKHSKKEISKYLSNLDSEYLLYKDGYVERDKENRYGNFSISILNEKNKLLGAVILMDSGTYDYDLDKYQEITDGQIDWYIEEINRLQNIYNKQKNNYYNIIPSILFNHIPIREFTSEYNNTNEIIISQDFIFRNNDENAEESKFFKTIKEMGSTKAFFVGHYHVMYYQVKVDDVVLGFAPQTSRNKMCYVYNFDSKLDFNTIIINNIED